MKQAFAVVGLLWFLGACGGGGTAARMDVSPLADGLDAATDQGAPPGDQQGGKDGMTPDGMPADGSVVPDGGPANCFGFFCFLS